MDFLCLNPSTFTSFLWKACRRLLQVCQKSRRIGCVIPRCNLQHRIMQPILWLFWHVHVCRLSGGRKNKFSQPSRKYSFVDLRTQLCAVWEVLLCNNFNHFRWTRWYCSSNTKWSEMAFPTALRRAAAPQNRNVALGNETLGSQGSDYEFHSEYRSPPPRNKLQNASTFSCLREGAPILKDFATSRLQ